MALPRLRPSRCNCIRNPSVGSGSSSSSISESLAPVFPSKQLHGSSMLRGLSPLYHPRIAELNHLGGIISTRVLSQSHQGLPTILPTYLCSHLPGLASLTARRASFPLTRCLKSYFGTSQRHFWRSLYQRQMWLQLPSSELGYRSAAVKRHLVTEGWRDRWESTKGKLRQALIQQPKAAVRNAIKDAPISNRTRLALSDAVSKPVEGMKNTMSRYKEAVGLQFDAFWRRNYLLLLGALGFGVCLLLWRIMFGIASTFVGLSERMANFGFFALAAAIVIFAGVILRSRYTINPDRVYRITMRKLHTSAAALEVLGPPLSGTDVRAYVMSGGGLRLKNLRPRLGSKRCFLIFPVRGSERNGLVNVEVKKKKGKYDLKLVAVDYTEAGREQRLYLIGDEVEYRVGGGLISELRDPILKAMVSQKEFDDQDEKEEEDEQKAEDARQKEELQLLERQSAKY